MSTKKINDFFKKNKIDSFLFFDLKNNKVSLNDKEQKIENFIIEFDFTILKIKSFSKDSMKISVSEKDYTKLKNNKNKNITIHYENNNYKKNIDYDEVLFLEKDQDDKNKYIFEVKSSEIANIITEILEDIYENEKYIEFLKLEKNEI